MLRLAALCLVLSAPAVAGEGEYIFDTLKKHPAYKQAYERMLAGQHGVPDWARTAAAVATPAAVLNLNGVEYEFHQLCKPHDCHDYNVLFLYAPQRNVLYAQVHQKGQVTLLGDPPRAEAAALGKLWTAQFRSP